MESIIVGVFTIIGALAPSVQKAITGGRTVEEAKADALAEARKHGNLGGPGGEWTDADDKRKERG